MSDLPEFRVVGGRNFKASGVDLCVYVVQFTPNYIPRAKGDVELSQYIKLCSIKNDTFKEFDRSIYSSIYNKS